MIPDRPPFTDPTPSRAPATPAGTTLLDALTGLAVSGRDLGVAGPGMLDLVGRAAGADGVLLLLEGLPGEKGVFRGGPRPEMLGAGARVLAREVNQGAQPLLVADVATDRRVPEGAVQDLLAGGCRSYLCQPLLAAGHSLGTLHLAGGAPERFDAAAVAAAAQAARVLSLAAQGHRARVEMELHADDRAREVALLLQVSRSLGDITSHADLVPLALDALGRVADPDAGTLLLLDGKGATLTLREQVPVSTALREAARSASLEAFRDAGGASPAEVHAREERAGSGPLLAEAKAWRSALHRALHRRGRVMGVLSLFAVRGGAFSGPEQRLLTTVAGQVSLTLERLERVRENERSRLESVVAAMGEGLLWIDASGRLQLSNPAGRRSLLDLTGDPRPAELPRLGEADLASILREFSGGRRTRCQMDVGSGRAGRSYTATAAPVRGRSGGCDGMVLVLSDVTEQLQLREQLVQTEKLSALGEMISGVAHELNNPLAAVMGFAQLLDGSRDLDDRVRRKVQGINREAGRCQRIVQSLLSFARHHRPRQEPVDLNGVVRTVMQLMEYPLRAEGVEVSLDLCPDLPAVRGDPHQLQQVVLNLVTNANHALQGAGRPGRLEIRSLVSGERVVLQVEDNGIGISPENLRRVFDPFFTTKKVGCGTGLGLSLAYGCIREHGGQIQVDSRVGEWTRFTIELKPCATAPAPAPEPPDAPRRRPSSGRDILVVDDEPAIAEFIAEALTAEGHRVHVVHDGLEAHRCLEDRTFDLIITDLKMPQMSGRELYEGLRDRAPDLASRVIFSTGDTVSRDTADFLRGFGDRYLKKPFRLAELHAMVDQVLGA